MAKAAALDPPTAWQSVSLVLTDDAGITQVNRQYLGVAGPTDVISLRYAPIPGDRDGLDGEIIVNVERAAGEGRRRARWSGSRELALYIAHGCDHLAGETDGDDAGRRRMRRRELRWLRELAAEHLVEGLLR